MPILSTSTQLLRKILDALLVTLIVVVLVGVALGRLVPMLGHQTFIIGGGSMEPAIPLGAAVVDEPVAPGDLRVGDVVSLRSGPELKSVFTHRITRLVPRADGLWIETKGDANRTIDPSITPSAQVIGRVVMTVPYGGYLLRLLSIPAGVIFVICLAGVLFAMTWLLETLEVDRRPRRARPPRPAPEPAGEVESGLASAAVYEADSGDLPRSVKRRQRTVAAHLATSRRGDAVAAQLAETRQIRARRATWLTRAAAEAKRPTMRAVETQPAPSRD